MTIPQNIKDRFWDFANSFEAWLEQDPDVEPYDDWMDKNKCEK